MLSVPSKSNEHVAATVVMDPIITTANKTIESCHSRLKPLTTLSCKKVKANQAGRKWVHISQETIFHHHVTSRIATISLVSHATVFRRVRKLLKLSVVCEDAPVRPHLSLDTVNVRPQVKAFGLYDFSLGVGHARDLQHLHQLTKGRAVDLRVKRGTITVIRSLAVSRTNSA